MTTGESAGHESIGKKALQAIRGHFGIVSAVTFIQIAARLAVLLPLVLPGLLGAQLPGWAGWTCAAVTYILLVIPLRFWGREKWRRLFFLEWQTRRQRNPYERWLPTGLLRHVRGLLCGVPFLAGFLYFVVGYSVLDVKTYEAPIHWLAMVLEGKSPSETGTGNVTLAIALIVGVMVLFAFLFAYGWWRDLPVEYLPVRSLGTRKSFRCSKRLRRSHGSEMRGNAVVNMLLSLPALIGFAAVVILYIRQTVDFSLPMRVVLNRAKFLLSDPLPPLQIVELLGVFLILYLPLCVLRKMRNAALVGKLLREQSEQRPSGEEKKADHPDEDKDPYAAG